MSPRAFQRVFSTIYYLLAEFGFGIPKNQFNHWAEIGAPNREASKYINERAAWKRSCQTTQEATKTPSIVLARREAPHCEVNLCQFVDANVVTIELVIVHCAIDY